MSDGFQKVESSKLQSPHVSFNHIHIAPLETNQFPPQFRHFSLNSNTENATKRPGIPPFSPCLSQNHVPRSPDASHFSAADSLPPLSPSPYREPTEQVPNNKTHRRSCSSDIPFGFSNILQSSPPLIPSKGSKGFNVPVKYIKRESSCWEKTIGENNIQGEVVNDLFSSYLNSFRVKNGEDSKANGGDHSGDNQVQGDQGLKRHNRSVSMDSAMGKINFGEESVTLPPSGGLIGRLARASIDEKSDTFSLDFGNGVFNDVELKKIMANENLAEMALADPKRVKRILANRQSAARSKERKIRYITELENKVQTLQTETTALSAQLTLLQRDSGSLTSEYNELKFRLQSMEHQAQLRNALNDTLTCEVQRLKMMTMELGGIADNFTQPAISPQMFRSHSQQLQQQNGGATTTHE